MLLRCGVLDLAVGFGVGKAYMTVMVRPNPARACSHIESRACRCSSAVPHSLLRIAVPLTLQVGTDRLPAWEYALLLKTDSALQLPGSPKSPSMIASAMSIGAAMKESVARAIRRKSTLERRNHMSDNQRRTGYSAATMAWRYQFCSPCADKIIPMPRQPPCALTL
jgi:hypothetical protein